MGMLAASPVVSRGFRIARSVAWHGVLLHVAVAACLAGERPPSIATTAETATTVETAPVAGPGVGRLKREPPPTFGPGTLTIDRVLVWRGERKGAIVFVTRPGAPEGDARASYILVPSATRAFRDLLRDLGFERAAVDAYLQQPVFELERATCLALAATPQICIDMRLRSRHGIDAQGQRQEELVLLADDTRRQLVETGVATTSPAWVGSTNLSLGTTRSAAGANPSGPTVAHHLNLAARGVLSKGDGLLQYDVTASHQPSDTAAIAATGATGAGARPRNGAHVNLLAWGRRLGLQAGTAYAGVFQSDIGMDGGGGSGAHLFLVRPAIVGLAWKSDGGGISAFGRTQRVRLQLLSPSHVRIVSQGAQLFEGTLQPGERIVSFPGYGQPFVEVIVRDALGVERRQRVEVLPADAADAPAFDPVRDPHGFYVDIGRPLLQDTLEGTRHRRFQVLDQTVLSFGHAYAGTWGRLRSGLQGGRGFTRIATALSDPTLSIQGSLMLGTHGERGIGGSLQPVLESGWQPSVSFTDYRTSRSASAPGAGDGDCRLLVDGLRCYAPTDYRSTTWGLGHRDWPLRLTYVESRLEGAVLRRATLQASLGVRIAGRQSSVLAMLGYEPGTRARSLLVVWVVPLEAGGSVLTGSVSTDLRGGAAVSVGHSRSLDPASHAQLRSYSLSASGSRSPGDGAAGTQGGAAAGHIDAQLGPVAHTTSLSAGRDTTSLQAGFSLDHALTDAGAAFTRENRGVVGSTRLFEHPGAAGVTIANRSQEPQTALIDGASVDVPATTNIYVPVAAGYLRGVTVSPGPALGEAQAAAGQYLHKGNVKSVVIADGFWVVARFVAPDGTALPVRFTARRPGERLERLYLDSRRQTVLFELREDGPTITRFVVTEGVDGRPGAEYRCTVPQADAPRPDQVATYRPLRYDCVPWTHEAPPR